MTRIINPLCYSRSELKDLDASVVPKRVGFIMDGNRRWATRQGKAKYEGHKAGSQALANLLTPALELGIEVMTVYGFSTENWDRPQSEVEALFELFEDYILREELTALSQRLQIDFCGNIDGLPDILRSICYQAKDLTHGIGVKKLVLALNYGGRDEICSAIKAIIEQVRSGALRREDVTEDLLTEHTHTPKMGGNLDLLIRTSGEMRVSNFLLWQLPGAEYIECTECWPEFDKHVLLRCLIEYQKRKQKKHGEQIK